jgi:hypothetical protein
MAPDAAYQDYFGCSVTAYGGAFVVGACNDDDKGSLSGANLYSALLSRY